jgi:transcriptional regulator with XRE-family HTH domain
MRNTLKEFLDKFGITGYELHKRTGISLNTVYRLTNNPEAIPKGDVLDAILNKFPDATLLDLLQHTPSEEMTSND